MSALGQRLLTLADVAKSKNKQIGKVAEVLVRHNPMLNDIKYMEMNEGNKHTVEIRSGLPDIYYRKANQAIPASKSTTEERSFTAAHFESKSQIDVRVARRGGQDRIAYNRWNQAQGHLQAHANEHAALTLYGSPSSDPNKSAGLMDVYSAVSGADDIQKQVLDCGGSGSDNASIMLVSWGEGQIYGVYPSGESAGLKRTDRGVVQIQATDTAGNPGSFWGYEEDFEIDHGLVIEDYRQGARAANIDVSDLQGGSGVDLLQVMTELTYKLDSLSAGQPVFYMPRTLLAYLDLQSTAAVKAGGGLTYMDYQGKPILSWRGIPVRLSDAMLLTEARVV